MENITLKTKYVESFLKHENHNETVLQSEKSLIQLETGSGAGNDFLGWMNTPYSNEYIEIIKLSDEFRSLYETIIVVGIGGSYLGSKAIISSLTGTFAKNKPEILFAGNNLCEEYHNDLLEYISDKNYGIIVISKSGTTTEPAIAFRLLKQKTEEKFGKNEASRRIIAITDSSKGALRKTADNEGYRTFVIPDDVGGRFSVLTPVGLLPVALAGINVFEILKGAQEIDNHTTSAIPYERNIVLQYAALRNTLYRQGKKIEVLLSYNPKMFFLIEWWKQLFGESEGKEGKGIFPAGLINTTDLHSMGQYVQDGERILFETVLSFETSNKEIFIKSNDDNLDGLNYLDGKSVFEINKKAEEGTLMAHIEGNVPNIIISIPDKNEFYLGQLLFFFEKACAVSAYNLGVNPFDQPGVEAYKSNMFKLLGKP
ncbi:MAG: glucose-6-phosphate isomerase [Deltaproteobacteria bacterium]